MSEAQVSRPCQQHVVTLNACECIVYNTVAHVIVTSDRHSTWISYQQLICCFATNEAKWRKKKIYFQIRRRLCIPFFDTSLSIQVMQSRYIVSVCILCTHISASDDGGVCVCVRLCADCLSLFRETRNLQLLRRTPGAGVSSECVYTWFDNKKCCGRARTHLRLHGTYSYAVWVCRHMAQPQIAVSAEQREKCTTTLIYLSIRWQVTECIIRHSHEPKWFDCDADTGDEEFKIHFRAATIGEHTHQSIAINEYTRMSVLPAATRDNHSGCYWLLSIVAVRR